MWNYATPYPAPARPATPQRRRLRQICWCLTALGATLLVTGCPYNGVALAEPDADTFEAALLGDWILLGADELEMDCPGAEAVVTFRRFNRAEYLVSIDQQCKVQHGRAFVTRMGDALFLNFQEDSLSAVGVTDSTSYSVMRVELSGDEMILRDLSENIGKPDTPAQLRELLERRLDDPAIYFNYEEPWRLRRRQ